MTSTIKVNNIQNQCGQNIINENSNTITIGASGDTIALASGASQSGFGRAGSVNWQTTPKTATFTAADGEGYFINSGSAITMNLPAGSAGAIVAVSDYARNFATYNLTISANGSEKIGGVTDDAVLNVDGQAATFVYVDSTKGWINVQNAEDTETGVVPTLIAATGGCITTSGDYKIHTFTGPGTFQVTAGAGPIAIADYMVVAGGASGGNNLSGGGGGGGFRESVPSPAAWTASPLANPGGGLNTIVGSYPVTVGGGGTVAPGANVTGNAGTSSVFSTITANGGGGGGGGCYSPGPNAAGVPGGSGGGTSGYSPTGLAGGTGNTPPVSPPQGSNGGNGGGGGPSYPAGGGGGATAVGGTAPNTCSTGQAGGAGAQTQIDTNNYYYSGGGGGGSYIHSPAGGAGGLGGGGGGGVCTPGSGGAGGGTARATGGAGTVGGPSSNSQGGAGGTNTGGGGGGSGHTSGSATGGAGGSGIVIIRYKFQ